MKKTLKLLLWIGIFTLSGFAASADIGDVAGKIYSTDILTQVDGLDIKSYAIDGKTLIILEDLENYGFTVYYNDNVRTLFVTKTGDAEPDFNPHIERGKVGAVVGDYYESDIKAYVNGRNIYKTYALDGKLAVPVEDMVNSIGSLKNFVYSKNFDDALIPVDVLTDKYTMTYTYDDDERLLSLVTKPNATLEEISSVLLDATTPWRATRRPVLHNDHYMYIPETLGGIMHGPYKARTIVSDVGISWDVLEIIRRYGLHSHMDRYTEVFDPVFSQDGEYMYFVHNFDGGYDYKKLQLSSMHILPAEEEEYNKASTYIKKSNYDFTLDKKDIPLYNIGGRDYVCIDDLQLAGFRTGIDRTTESVSVINTQFIPDGYIPSDFTEGQAEKVSNDVTLFLNGGFTTFHSMFCYEGKYLIPIDLFTYDYLYTEGMGTIKYYYDTNQKKIIGRTAEDTLLNYAVDQFDLSQKSYSYDLVYNSELEKTYDSGDEFDLRIAGYETELFLIVSDWIIHPISHQLRNYLLRNNIDEVTVLNNTTKYDFDGEIVTITPDGGEPIKYSVTALAFIEKGGRTE